MPTPVDPTMLLERAGAYLRDARNLTNSMHTRYTAAVSALGCLYHAGMATDTDWERVEAWEPVRYDPAAWPTAMHVDGVVKRVEELIKGRTSSEVGSR